jgi:hypothetical protein
VPPSGSKEKRIFTKLFAHQQGEKKAEPETGPAF